MNLVFHLQMQPLQPLTKNSTFKLTPRMGQKSVSASWQISTWHGLTESQGFLLCFANCFALLQREGGREEGRERRQKEGGKEGERYKELFYVGF